MVDSSFEPIIFLDPNVVYLHDPDLKIFLGTTNRTEFTVLAADDDFPIINNIERSSIRR